MRVQKRCRSGRNARQAASKRRRASNISRGNESSTNGFGVELRETSQPAKGYAEKKFVSFGGALSSPPAKGTP